MNKKINALLATAITAVLLAACAPQQNANGDVYDPMEKMNRGIFAFNTFVDKGLIRPIAVGYRYITPDGIRSRIGHFSDNLREPLNMINAFLQGDFTQGMTSFWRFTINTTIGIGGLNDVATTAGLNERREDFGQTLGVWGSGDGPYVVIPILGPSNGRDVLGRVVDWFSNPIDWELTTWQAVGVGAGQGLVERERLIGPIDDMYDTSLDPYTTFKSAYTQHRDAAIKNSSGATTDYYNAVGPSAK
ncbi:MAG: VacJ family lipoprotein [Alphaproteobacteria bacterium]